MAMVESKAFELLLEGSPFAISAQDFGHDSLDMVQTSSNRCHDGIVIQKTDFSIALSEAVAARAARSLEHK